MSSSKKRVKLTYLPEFKGEIEGYVVNSITRNLWRVSPLFEREDLMQEAYVVFLRCAGRYPILDEAKHFMALFKTAWNNHLHDLSKKATRLRETQVQEADPIFDQIGSLDNDGPLLTMIRQAPREILLVLNLFLNAPQELLNLATQTWDRNKRHQRADQNELVSRLIGVDPTLNILEQTRDYFRDA